MAERDSERKELFIKRAREFAYAVLFGYTLLLLGAFVLYPFFKMPVSPRLVWYVYAAELLSGTLSYGIAFLIRKLFLPVRAEGEYWGFIAMRRYFWSYAFITLPYFIGYLMFVFSGHLPSVLLGYLISSAGVIIFLPKKGDVI
ncbi:MAG: hypothetical protein GXN96_01890 [Aquificae bacterium]|nr:hypothetical protein [Aquificota bacterium]